MKIIILAAALAAISTTVLHAQSISYTPGYTGTQLFTTSVGESISGLETDSSGNVYYLLNDSTSTKLLSRSPGDNYASATPLFDFGTPAYGSYVRLNANKLYFSESTAGTIRTYDLGTTTTNLLATVAGNYELDFYGGVGYLSADPGFTGNRVFSLDLGTGATAPILTSTDYSGPLAMGPTGELYYGATLFGAGGGIYRYSAGEVSGGGLTLDAGHLVRPNLGNAYFDFDGVMELYQSDFSSLVSYDIATLNPTTLASTPDSFANIASGSGFIFATVTQSNSFMTTADDISAVYRVTPEPSTGLLLACGALLALRRRRA